jgi:hypothetical protein
MDNSLMEDLKGHYNSRHLGIGGISILKSLLKQGLV